MVWGPPGRWDLYSHTTPILLYTTPILLPWEIPIPYGKMNESPVSQGGPISSMDIGWESWPINSIEFSLSLLTWRLLGVGEQLSGPYQTPTNWLPKNHKALVTVHVLVYAHNIMGDLERNMFHAYVRIYTYVYAYIHTHIYVLLLIIIKIIIIIIISVYYLIYHYLYTHPSSPFIGTPGSI